MDEIFSVVENYPSPLILLQGKRMVGMNNYARELLKCSNFHPQDMEAFFHPDPAYMQQVERFMQSAAQNESETKINHSFQEELSYDNRLLQTNLSLLRQQNGTSFYTLFIKDITSEREIEHNHQVLEQQRAFLEPLCRNYITPLLILDQSGRITYVNEAFRDFIKPWNKLTEEQLIFRKLQKTGLDKTLLTLLLRLKDNLSSTSRQEEKFELTQNRQIAVQAYRLELNEQPAFLFHLEDQSHHLQKLNEYKTQVAEWQMMAERAPDAIIKFNTEYKISFVNQATEEFFGTCAEELLDHTLEQMPLAQDNRQIMNEMLQFVFRHAKARRLELSLSSEKFVDCLFAPVFDEEGKVVFVIFNARDLTYLKEIENRLRLSHEELNFALQISNMAPWSLDLEREECMLNPQVAAFLGIPEQNRPKRIALDELIDQYILAEDREKLRKDYRKLINHQIHELKHQFRVSCEGKIRYLEAHSKILSGQANEGHECYGVVQDVTAYHKRQQELQAYQNQLEELVETQTEALKINEERMSDAIKLASLGRWELQFGSEIVACDEQVAEMLGLPKEASADKFKISLRKVWKMLRREDLVAFKRMQSKALKTPAERFFEQLEIRVQLPGQEEKYFLITVKSRKEQQRPFRRWFYGNFQDITHIRYAETNENTLGEFIDATVYWVAITDDNCRLTYLNQSAMDFFGFDAQEWKGLNVLSGQNSEGLAIFDPEQLEVARRRGFWKGERLLSDLNGQQLSVSQVIQAHRGIMGEVLCYSTIISDLSEFKKVQLELLKQQEELDTFIYHASHDLKGPIATLKGLNQLINQEFEDPHALRYFKKYNAQTDKLYNILMSLIKLASIKEQEVRKIPVLFDSLIDSALASNAHMIGYEEVDFRKHISLEQVYHGDFQLLQIVFEQLFKNAISFRNLRQKAVTSVTVFNEEQSLFIEIKDNGQGMDKKIQDKVFNMFYKGTETAEGPGLGLYLVWTIVEKMKGEIILESEKGEGTRFLIKLPFV